MGLVDHYYLTKYYTQFNKQIGFVKYKVFVYIIIIKKNTILIAEEILIDRRKILNDCRNSFNLIILMMCKFRKMVK